MIPRNDEGAAIPKLEYVPTTIPTTRAKGESTKHLAANQEQDEHGEERQTTSQNGFAKAFD